MSSEDNQGASRREKVAWIIAILEAVIIALKYLVDVFL